MKRRGFFATSMWEDIKQELGILDKEDLHAHRLGLPDGSVRMCLDGRMVVLDRDEENTLEGDSMKGVCAGTECVPPCPICPNRVWVLVS